MRLFHVVFVTLESYELDLEMVARFSKGARKDKFRPWCATFEILAEQSLGILNTSNNR